MTSPSLSAVSGEGNGRRVLAKHSLVVRKKKKKLHSVSETAAVEIRVGPFEQFNVSEDSSSRRVRLTWRRWRRILGGRFSN